MKALIMKDVNLIGVWGHLGMIFISLLLSFMMPLSIEIFRPDISILIFVFISFFIHTSIISMISKSNQDGDISLNSLPLKKEKIVLGRYLSFLIYAVGVPIFIYILYFFMSLNFVGVSNRKLSLLSILVAIPVLAIYNAIYLFSHYNNKNDSKSIELVAMLFIFGFIIFSGRYPEYIKNINLLRYLESFNIVLLLLLIFSIIANIASFNISKKMYKKKEF